MSNAFGTTLRALRTARRMSLSELGLDAGLHHAAISRFESGQRHPKRASVLLLAAALRLDQREETRLLRLAGFVPNGEAVEEDEPPVVSRLRVALMGMDERQAARVEWVIDAVLERATA